jgi:ribonuclease J
LVTDLYAASLADAIGRGTIPKPGYPSYRVYVPNRQRVLVRDSEQYHRMDLVRSCRVFPEWLADHAGEVTLLQPASTVPELLRAGVLVNGTVVWSMWPGYLLQRSGERLLRELEAALVPLALDHASGHARVTDLRRLVGALSPRCVVPIHTEAADHYHHVFENVTVRDDAEWWAV